MRKSLMQVRHFHQLRSMKLRKKKDLSLDVVSGGELYTAVQADFPRERIHFHGNNKSNAELEYRF